MSLGLRSLLIHSSYLYIFYSCDVGIDNNIVDYYQLYVVDKDANGDDEDKKMMTTTLNMILKLVKSDLILNKVFFYEDDNKNNH